MLSSNTRGLISLFKPWKTNDWFAFKSVRLRIDRGSRLNVMYTITVAIISERASTGASMRRRLVPLALRATISLSPDSRPSPTRVPINSEIGMVNT